MKQIHFQLKLSIILCILSVSAFAQDTEFKNSYSAGIRFNNPFGISIKKYWNDKAIELVVGRSNPWKSNGYYRFRSKHEADGYNYIGYDPIYRPLVLQARFMKHASFSKISQLSFYYGLGGEARNYNYYLNYSYENAGNTYYKSYREHDFAIGLDALAGIEFKFKSLPLVIFYDLNLYAEIIEQPLYMNFESSWGLRYYW